MDFTFPLGVFSSWLHSWVMMWSGGAFALKLALELKGRVGNQEGCRSTRPRTFLHALGPFIFDEIMQRFSQTSFEHENPRAHLMLDLPNLVP